MLLHCLQHNHWLFSLSCLHLPIGEMAAGSGGSCRKSCWFVLCSYLWLPGLDVSRQSLRGHSLVLFCLFLDLQDLPVCFQILSFSLDHLYLFSGIPSPNFPNLNNLSAEIERMVSLLLMCASVPYLFIYLLTAGYGMSLSLYSRSHMIKT